jgi:hypothetical protein
MDQFACQAGLLALHVGATRGLQMEWSRQQSLQVSNEVAECSLLGRGKCASQTFSNGNPLLRF